MNVRNSIYSGGGRMKLQVLVSDELCEKIDYWANKIGIPRSSFCAMLLGQGVMGFEKANEIIDGMKDDILSNPELLAKM